MPQQWNRLSKDQAHGVLDKLSTHSDAIVFSKEATEVSVCSMPFYSHYKLYRLINYATMPSFSMQYLSNGVEFISLDGTANPLYTANEKDPLKLTESNVIPYLDFFFSYVQGSEGDIFLIKDPRKMPVMSSLNAEQQQSIINSYKPLQVATNDKGWLVSGTLYYDGSLLSAAIQVTPNGKLAFQDQALLLQGIHFPQSLSPHEWLEVGD